MRKGEILAVLPPKKAVDQNSLPLLKSKNEKQNAEK
jgi:hypothetical protein